MVYNCEFICETCKCKVQTNFEFVKDGRLRECMAGIMIKGYIIEVVAEHERYYIGDGEVTEKVDEAYLYGSLEEAKKDCENLCRYHNGLHIMSYDGENFVESIDWRY